MPDLYGALMINKILRTLSAIGIVAYCMAVNADNRIMLIHSYHQELQWVEDVTRGIREELLEGHALSIHYMDTKRIPVDMFQQAADEAFQEFKEQKPDLVIICDDNALKLLGLKISATTPLVFCGINGDIRADYPWVVKEAHVTGVMERPLIKRTIAEFIKQTGHHYKKALILLGGSPTARAFHLYDLGNQARLSVNRTTSADVLRISDLESWKNAIRDSRTNGYDLLLVAGFGAMKDSEGRYVSLDELSNWVGKHSPVPALTVHKQAIAKDKIMAGMIVSGTIMGQDVARLANLMLNTPVNSGKISIVTQNLGRYIFSRSALRANGIEPPVANSDQVQIIP